IVWETHYSVAGGIDWCETRKVEQAIRLQGQYFDDESGLHYNRYRYFDPNTGIFISQDPIGLVGGLNPYRYAPNPINWIDPLGLTCTKAFNKRNNIAKRWVDNLTGKKPHEVDAFLRSKGYTPSIHKTSANATPHTRYTRTTRNGDVDILDHHPGGGIHGSDYWKVYRNGEVQGRIGHGSFSKYDKIYDSPVYVNGVLMNSKIEVT
ncbi:RHS repeat-associated core domain-containing protein, partial [Caballeronia sp. LZ032]|uniref:RHS repeat-associated core domain-containing protein n=1 Tax=Caballeronia sp. LZ032 TaxID=3038565 RepID=UPI002859448F